jgi:nucleotide-binding universal stress UspA family protein
MFRTLVVPLDGSELAERALPYAVQLAASGKGQLVLLRVALAPPPARLDGADWEQQQTDAVQEAEAYLTLIAQRVPAAVPVNTSVPYGRAVPQILATVEQLGADGIVMATHGRTGMAHLLYGSVAEALQANSPVPVFLVFARPGEAPAPPFNPLTARAIVPLDGSAYAESALQTAADLIGPTGELVLVCVVEPPDQVVRDDFGRVVAYLDQQEEARTREARDYLARLAGQLGIQYPGIAVTLDIRIGEPASGIVIAAVDRAADLVVMATHGRTGFRRAVMGSVAGAVLRTGSTPVVLVGPHESHRPAGILVGQGTASLE